LIQGFEFAAFGGIARGVGPQLVQAQLHGLEVSGEMLQLRVGRIDQKPFAHQALELLLNILHHLRMALGVLELALHQREFGQQGPAQTCHLLRNKVQASTPFLHSLLEHGIVLGQGVQQEGSIHRDLNQLRQQLVGRSATATIGSLAHLHVGHDHGLQTGNILFQVLERITDLQGKQATQTTAVAL
jgi:hypothetical protein